MVINGLKPTRSGLLLVTALFMVLLNVMSITAHAQSIISLRIPSIDVEAEVVSVGLRAFDDGSVTWDVSGISAEVGLFEGLAGFGEGGNVGLGGHSVNVDGTPSVFYALDQVAVGDEIFVIVDGVERHYVVSSTSTVDYHDLTIFYPTDDERLTLITCDIDSYTGTGYQARIVVVAEPVG